MLAYIQILYIRSLELNYIELYKFFVALLKESPNDYQFLIDTHVVDRWAVFDLLNRLIEYVSKEQGPYPYGFVLIDAQQEIKNKGVHEIIAKGFKISYFSPEQQAAFIALITTKFDTVIAFLDMILAYCNYRNLNAFHSVSVAEILQLKQDLTILHYSYEYYSMPGAAAFGSNECGILPIFYSYDNFVKAVSVFKQIYGPELYMKKLVYCAVIINYGF